MKWILHCNLKQGKIAMTILKGSIHVERSFEEVGCYEVDHNRSDNLDQMQWRRYIVKYLKFDIDLEFAQTLKGSKAASR